MLPSARVVVKTRRNSSHSVSFVLWRSCLIEIAQFRLVRDLMVDDFDGAETIALCKNELVFLHEHLLLVDTLCSAYHS